MGKPTICIGENKGADQLRSNCEADQRLCFRYSDSTIPLLFKSEISSFWLFSVLVQVGLCRTCSETTLLVFPRGGSNARTNHIFRWQNLPQMQIPYLMNKFKDDPNLHPLPLETNEPSSSKRLEQIFVLYMYVS